MRRIMTTINIYYGGRGLIDDPTIYVMDKISKVFDELNVNVNKYNLYEDKRGISVLPKTLKEADAIVIAASSADFYNSFSMPAGFTETKKSLKKYI